MTILSCTLQQSTDSSPFQPATEATAPASSRSNETRPRKGGSHASHKPEARRKSRRRPGESHRLSENARELPPRRSTLRTERRHPSHRRSRPNRGQIQHTRKSPRPHQPISPRRCEHNPGHLQRKINQTRSLRRDPPTAPTTIRYTERKCSHASRGQGLIIRLFTVNLSYRASLRSITVAGRSFDKGPIAQWLEQSAHNALVPGSSPGGPTKTPVRPARYADGTSRNSDRTLFNWNSPHVLRK